MTRRWRHLRAWFVLHPAVGRWLRRGAITVLVVVALGGLVLTVRFNADSNSQRKADTESRKAAGAEARIALCPLIYAYTHPPAGTPSTDRSDQVIEGWRKVGALIGCPDGIQPKP